MTGEAAAANDAAAASNAAAPIIVPDDDPAEEVAVAPAAPFGYTKAGKPRKRPAPEPYTICPVKGCKTSFKHRAKPRQAMWQHLLVFFKPTHMKEGDEMGRLHREAHAKAKAEVKAQELTGKLNGVVLK